MGTFRVTLAVGDPQGGQYTPVEALVDTGATYTTLPASILRELGVVPHDRAEFELADGNVIERDIGRTWVRIDGKSDIVPVVFGDEKGGALLGAVTLEIFRLAVGPVSQRLVQVRGLLMSLNQWFRRQDDVVAANRAEFAKEFLWLDSAIGLLTDLQLFVNTDAKVSAARMALESKDPDKYLATTLTVNLLNDAMGSLVSATRLLLFGDHPDAYALIRSAFEACCYAEHFVYHPDKTKSYMELEAVLSGSGLSTDLEVNLGPELRKRCLEFWRVSKELEIRSGNPVRGFYARLCNLGSHPSPKRVGLRLSPPGGAVLVLSQPNCWQDRDGEA